MITVYEDLSYYDGFYVSDDLSLACQVIDLGTATDAAGALVEFRVPVCWSRKELRRALDYVGLTIADLRQIQDKKERRAEMVRALVVAGYCDPYWPRHYSEPDSFVFLPEGDEEGLEKLKQTGWIKMLDKRFKTWDEVMDYIRTILDGRK